MPLKWNYCVTTCPARIADGLLQRTLTSLAAGGFDNPRVFVDGDCKLPDWLKKYPLTQRSPGVRTFMNWVLAAWEIYGRQPTADRYAIFQDDFVTYKGLREYLEKVPYPAKGYKNLYTFPENEKHLRGFYESNQLGRGAVALVFSNEALRVLLAQPHFVNRPLDPHRGWRRVDGGIIDSMRKAGWKEYVHGPSLVQHTGIKSSMGNRRHPLANTFMGEEFDARSLLPKSETLGEVRVNGPTIVPKGKRIGLVGFHCNTGLSEVNRQLATHCKIDVWMVKPHPKGWKTNPAHPDVDTIICPTGAKTEQFLQRVDTVVFVEKPIYDNLIPLAVQMGKRIVCIPMLEWMPPGAKGWPQTCARLICPTAQCQRIFSHVARCVYAPWPVDTARFKFVERKTCNQFLFLNGRGGWGGRKGADVLREALKLWPEMPVLVRSQMRSDWGAGINFLPEVNENTELYDVGDVLIAPHTVDGLGLEPMEAMACGMPVVTTNGKPWNEIPALGRIPCKIERRKVQRPVDWHLPDPKALVEMCKGLLGTDVSQASREARQWAEGRSWTKYGERMTQLIRGEVDELDPAN